MKPWRRLILAGLGLLLVPVYYVAVTAPAAGVFHDDGVLLVTAKALAEGKGYRILSLPEEIPQTKYPIAFPAVLAAVWKAYPRFPQNILLLKLVPLFFALLWFYLTWSFVKEETQSPDRAAWIALLTAASPWVLFLSSNLLSETMFACLATASLLWLRRWERDPGERPNRKVIVSAALAAAAFLTRSAGLPLLAAGVAVLAWKRDYKRAALFALICAAAVAPWFYWQASHAASQAYYTSQNYRDWNIVAGFSPEQKLAILGRNILFQLGGPVSYFGAPIGAPGLTFSVLFVLLALYGFITDARRSLSATHVFLLLYFAMLMLWAWPPARFVVPVLPLALLFAHKGLTRIAGRKWLQAAATATLVAILALALQRGASATLTWKAVYPLHQRHDDWGQVTSLLSWARDHLPPDAVVLGNLDPTIYLYTHRKAVRGFTADPYLLYYAAKPENALGSRNDFLRRLLAERVTHLFRMPCPLFEEAPALNAWIDDLAAQRPRVLTLAAGSQDSEYRLYQLNRVALQRLLDPQWPDPSSLTFPANNR